MKIRISLGILLISLFLFANVVDSKKRVNTKKQEELKYLNTNQRNHDVHADSKIKNKVKMMKGTIQKFLMQVGFTVAQLKPLLAVPLINYTKIMHIIRDIIAKKQKIDYVKNIVPLLGQKGVEDIAGHFNDLKKAELAVNSVKEFYAPVKVLPGKSATPAASKKTRRRLRRMRRYYRRS